MSSVRTVTIEIPAESEASVRRFLALQEELNSVAMTAPHGRVLDDCEAAVLEKGRTLEGLILSDALESRIREFEKKAVRPEPADAAGRRRTGARKPAGS